MQYKLNHRCGCRKVYNIFGNSTDRDRKVEWLEGQICYTCANAKEREKAVEKGLKLKEELGLPELVGSPAQIKWAEQIRGEAVEETEIYRTKGESELAVATDPTYRAKVQLGLSAIHSIYARTSASWWIDNRTIASAPLMFIQAAAESLTKAAGGLSPDEFAAKREEEARVKAAADAEATVFAQDSQSPLVAVVTILENSVEMSYPAKDDAVRTIAKDLGLRWNETKWAYVTGNPSELAVELGHRLLGNKTHVRIYDAELRRRAVAGEYKAKPSRRVSGIVAGKYVGWFGLEWRREEDFFAKAKRIQGAKYVKPLVVVPPDAWREVADFAAIHDFAISNVAEKLIEDRRNLDASAIKVVVDAKQKDKENKDAIAALLAAEKLAAQKPVEVPDELKD